MLRNNHIRTFLLFLAATLLLTGCSTKKNTITRRAYHNLTSHYNVYWNGEHSLQDGDRQLKTSVKDDYTKVLRVYNYGSKTDAMALNSQMDRAIQKTAVCVQKHSMKFNGRERVKWIDDAYLVMAKAHFYKQDYIPAKRTFDFVSTEFRNTDVALVSDLWLIKTYTQTEQYPKAIATIEQLQAKMASRKKLPKELHRNFNLTVADYYIATKDYRNAINYLKAGLLETNSRDMRTRVRFILGQIYMELNDGKRATEQFKKVIKKNPPYEMLFEAKMNMAKMGSSGNAKELYKMLNRMLNDRKNEEYADRIYYAMAELALREDNVNKAIGFFRQSVAEAKNNRIQRAYSSLKLATILFERNDYELSQAYYDTAVSAMEKNYPGYDSIANLSRTLNDLVANLTVIREQDSLLKVANMDSVSRNAVIDKIIAQVIEEERIQKEREQYEEQLAMMGGAVSNTSSALDPGNASQGWYFYNENTLRNGFSEFSKKWGMRKLEDNWRISDKRSIENGMMEDTKKGELAKDGDPEKEGEEGKKEITNHDREYYLKDLPFTPEQQAEAHKQIASSLYNVGFLYLDRLSDYPRSIESYERLDTRYPGNEKELPSWYALYKMHNDLKHTEQAEDYKNRILSKYPESSYASVILDPTYFEKLKEESQQASVLYSKTYDAFQQGQYYRVRMNTERAMSQYSADTTFAPRFALLDAISRGRLETVDTMAYALLDVVRTYPTSSVHDYAVELLQHVNHEYKLGLDLSAIAPKDKAGEKEEELEWPYTKEPDTQHLVIIAFNSKAIRTEPLKVRLSDFNKKEHRFKTFEVKNMMLQGNTMLISLSAFENEQAARDYITSMFLTDYLFGGMKKDDYSVLPISVKNLAVLLKEKSIEDYKDFLDGKKRVKKEEPKETKAEQPKAPKETPKTEKPKTEKPKTEKPQTGSFNKLGNNSGNIQLPDDIKKKQELNKREEKKDKPDKNKRP